MDGRNRSSENSHVLSMSAKLKQTMGDDLITDLYISRQLDEIMNAYISRFDSLRAVLDSIERSVSQGNSNEKA